MKKLIGSWLLASLAVTVHARTPEGGLKIEVHVYNYADVSPEMLAQAEQETARIYQWAGLAIEWLNCPRTAEELTQNTTCDVPGGPTRFTLRLLSNEMARRFPVGGDIFGFALLPVYQGFGVVANVFAGRAREMAPDEEWHRVLLGHLIAHELGHLLLGEAGHPAGAGVMHVPWRTKELDEAKRGGMLFLPEQAKQIRAQVMRRAASQQEP
jgi:hypothetical protein